MEPLLWTALLMGLAGGPHCVAMCAAPCAAICRVRGPHDRTAAWQYHAGRVLGYSLAGGVAAAAMQSLAWVSTQTAALRPAWMLLHLAVLAWGLMLLAQARQPAWVDSAGRAVWSRVQPWVGKPGGPLVSGMLWALMPCGLLYSALLVAALAGGPLQGALAMALFAAGSAVSLVLAPWLLLRLHDKANHWRQQWGTRLAGALLAGAALWALWMDLSHRLNDWCAI